MQHKRGWERNWEQISRKEDWKGFTADMNWIVKKEKKRKVKTLFEEKKKERKERDKRDRQVGWSQFVVTSIII